MNIKYKFYYYLYKNFKQKKMMIIILVSGDGLYSIQNIPYY